MPFIQRGREELANIPLDPDTGFLVKEIPDELFTYELFVDTTPPPKNSNSSSLNEMINMPDNTQNDMTTATRVDTPSEPIGEASDLDEVPPSAPPGDEEIAKALEAILQVPRSLRSRAMDNDKEALSPLQLRRGRNRGFDRDLNSVEIKSPQKEEISSNKLVWCLYRKLPPSSRCLD
jgi:hypothetical protein